MNEIYYGTSFYFVLLKIFLGKNLASTKNIYLWIEKPLSFLQCKVFQFSIFKSTITFLQNWESPQIDIPLEFWAFVKFEKFQSYLGDWSLRQKITSLKVIKLIESIGNDTLSKVVNEVVTLMETFDQVIKLDVRQCVGRRSNRQSLTVVISWNIVAIF